MKSFGVDVALTTTVVRRVFVTAKDKEEAKQKIRDWDVDDILDEFEVECGEITDFDFFDEQEVQE